MSACYTSNQGPEESDSAGDRPGARQRVLVSVSDELLAAVEGWRHAHGLDQSEAIGKLVRLGLMSEIAKIYRLVSENRTSANDKGTQASERKPRRQERRLRESRDQGTSSQGS